MLCSAVLWILMSNSQIQIQHLWQCKYPLWIPDPDPGIVMTKAKLYQIYLNFFFFFLNGGTPSDFLKKKHKVEQ